MVHPYTYIYTSPIIRTTKRIFLGCVKKVRATKSEMCLAQGEYV
jgi:hypothetical protein